MPLGTRRRAAVAAQTAATALFVAGVVCGAGYGLQRVALRAPTDGERLAARAVGVMLRYRYVESELHIAGQPTRQAACLEGWQVGRKGRPAGRGARIAFSDGERLLLGDRRAFRLEAGPNPPRLPPIAEVELAGCPRPISNHIAAKLVDGSRARAVEGSFHGQAALRIHLRTRRSRLDLYVNRTTLLPLGVRVEARGIVAWSRLRPVPLTPERKRSFLAEFDG